MGAGHDSRSGGWSQWSPRGGPDHHVYHECHVTPQHLNGNSISRPEEEADILLPHIHFRARIQIDIFYHLSVGQFLASLEENIIYDSNNNDCYLAGQRSNCQFGKSTLRQKVWKFTVDKLTNGQPSLCRYYRASDWSRLIT